MRSPASWRTRSASSWSRAPIRRCGGDVLSQGAAAGFDEGRQRLAKAYERTRLVVGLGRSLSFYAVAAALVLTGGATGLRDLVRSLAANEGVQIAVYVLLFVALLLVPLLPLSYYGGYVVERRYGLSTQGKGSWWGDRAKAVLLGVVLSVVAAEFLLYALRSLPDLWWLAVWAAALAATVVLSVVAPVLLLPLFFKLEPLRDEALAGRLRTLAERAGAPVLGVFVLGAGAKTRKANAAVVGLLPTRRIVLFDTLLDRFAPDEIAAILAHELAHHVHWDWARSLLRSAAASFVALVLLDRALRLLVPLLGYEGLTDVAILPLVALFLALLSLAFRPVELALSRRGEAKADAFAVRLLGEADPLVSGLVKLHDQNLGHARPARLVEWLAYTHPPGARRIASARRAAEERR